MSTITKKDLALLKLVTEYNVLIIDQLAILNNTGKRIVQKRIARLLKNGLIKLAPRNKSTKQGHPENIISINERGVSLLKDENLIDCRMLNEKLFFRNNDRVEHDLLLNWFKIHLQFLLNEIDDLKVEFISLNSPIAKSDNRQPVITENFSHDNLNIEFIPDGVFYIKSEKHNKSLLFFLEVDMGTESLSSRNTKSNNIISKIKNYRAYFQSEKYKRYQKKWNTLFNGFRLLFLTNTHVRKNKISNLINYDKSNDFIWVAHKDDLFDKGLGAQIWARGGNLNSAQESILGPTLNFEEKLINSK